MMLDGLNALTQAPEKFVSEKFALSVIPRNSFLDILLGFESEPRFHR